MKSYITRLHYTKHPDFEGRLLSIFLCILKLFYYIAVEFRLLLYKTKIKKTRRIAAFVISVGNLTTGGTGKTPVSVALANHFSETLNKTTAILSRGYGGKLSNSQVNTISDGNNIFFSAHMSGDEPYWLAYNAKKTIVLTCKNRIEAAKEAIDKYNAQVLILDDGFQHIKLHRDLNIMLVDGLLKFGNDCLLPQGPLREPKSEISRADCILVMNKNAFDEKAAERCSTFSKELEHKYNKPCFVCNFKPTGIFNLKTKDKLFAPEKVYAFSGIGQPQFFFNYLKQDNYTIVKERCFSDHHLYTKDDVKNILEEAMTLNAEAIVTTEKDAVKIKAFLDKIEQPVDFYALKLGLDINIPEILAIKGFNNQ